MGNVMAATKALSPALLASARADELTLPIRVESIGFDSSHGTAFTQILNHEADRGEPGLCQSNSGVLGRQSVLFAFAFVLATGFPCQHVIASETLGFIKQQQSLYAEFSDSRHKAWSDFSQVLLACNVCLYRE
jgi:hypothetical protein